MRVKIENVEGGLLVKVDSILAEVAARFTNYLGDNAPKRSGQLAQSFQVLGYEEGRYVVGSPLRHAVYVHYGRKAYPNTRKKWPPIAPLKVWCRRQLGDESLAYAVRHKIGMKGIDPNPFVERAIKQLRSEYG